MHCPVCSKSSDSRKAGTFGEYTLYKCPCCDVVYSFPMKSPGSEWYESESSYKDHNLINEFLPVSTAWWHDQFLKSGNLYGKDLLDVGCGPGVFLREAKKLGYRVHGIDFNAESVRVARERFGLENVECMSVESFASRYPDRKFDVITFFDVLEHIEDPRGFISLIKTRLRPGGSIALNVPNRERVIDNLGEADNPPHHLTRWSPKSLVHFFESNGFEVVKVSVKDLTAEDLTWIITSRVLQKAKGRLSRKVAQTAAGNQRPPLSYRYYSLLKKFKNVILKAALLPVIPFLWLMRLKGVSIYCVAKMK